MAAQPKEAPGELAAVRAFVNTLDIDHGVEELSGPDELVAWLAERDLIEPAATAGPGDLQRAVAFREALRELMLSNNDGRPLPLDAARTLAGVGDRSRLRLRVDPDGGARLETEGTSVDAALGRLLVIVYRAMEHGTWSRLKACRDDTCRWAFYDHSKNRSGHWCSMEVCGARNKAQAYRARQKSK